MRILWKQKSNLVLCSNIVLVLDNIILDRCNVMWGVIIVVMGCVVMCDK